MIVSHGYIDPRTYVTDDSSYAQFIAAFARAGYLVLKPDFRGHGKSQGVAEGGYLSPVYTYDLLNLVSTVTADPRVDRTRIGLFGHSLGGYQALRAMVISSGHQSGGVHVRRGGLARRHLLQLVDGDGDAHRRTAAGATAGGAVAHRQQRHAAHRPRLLERGLSRSTTCRGSRAAVQIDEDVNDSQVPKLFSDHLYAALQAAGTASSTTGRTPATTTSSRSNRAAVLANILAFYRAHL